MIYLRTLSTLPRCSVQHALAAPVAFSLKRFSFPLFPTKLSNHRCCARSWGKSLTPLARKSNAISRVVFTRNLTISTEKWAQNCLKLKFPSESELLKFLSAHPLTCDSNLIENEMVQTMIQTIAQNFANEKIAATELKWHVLFALYDLELELPHSETTSLQTNICKALQDCAKEWAK